MDTKLTLKLDKSIIEEAKKYAKDKNLSLSRMMENYLQILTKKPTENIEISPLVESLTGIIKIENDDYKKDYTRFLIKKHE
ncbi:DUF6364 family protein [Pedobacter cryophilus]|uniref:Antitoxin n=1 Tax=Pedobacter cryophilus TaxID=2571271 RepID=A0A4U1BYA2_9SPHI|nr:DUF6364 family protein [Pedobacter cryophilus]TKB97549.1 hypothetical protein FA046_09255 [Pedobacter cryophilus]